jgi:putative membrane protein
VGPPRARRRARRPVPRGGQAADRGLELNEEPEYGDASRRTLLAVERTYLAWWRTGLTSFAVALGAGKVVPALTTGATWPYALIGCAFAVIGIICIVYAEQRRREVEKAARAGSFVSPHTGVTTALVVGGTALGLALMIVTLSEL